MRTKVPLFLALGLAFLLGGCGYNTGTTSGSVATATPNTSSPTNGPSTARTGSITLHTNALSYKASDTIMVTVSNQSSQVIYFPDHLTNCTVILLQRQRVEPQATDRGQDGINPCRLAIATRLHSLGPGQSLMVKLVAPETGWLTGLYIAALSYHTSPGGVPSAPVSSKAFTVGPLAPQV